MYLLLSVKLDSNASLAYYNAYVKSPLHNNAYVKYVIDDSYSIDPGN